MILAELEKEGQNIRKAYQRRLPSDTSRDYYFMQRNTGNTESITVEYGFLDSKNDDVAQLKNYWENYAEAVVRAVAEYIGIPYKPITGSNYYQVKKGDSLYSIANKYNTTVNDLKALNNLTSNNLSIGQYLKLPNTDVNTNSQALEGTYIVKSGDSLYGIANQYGISVNELKQYNNLSSNVLRIGQVLKVPTLSQDVSNEETTYTVKSGDTLYGIANQYGVSVNELKQYNNLSSNILTIGQILRIPSESESLQDTGETYIVKSGDSLYSIAKKYNISVDELKRRNNLVTNLLSIGQVLYI